MIPSDELHRLNMKELREEVEKAQMELFKLRLGVSSQQEKQTSKIKLLRKYVARLKTRQTMLAREQLKENTVSAVTK